MPRIGSFGPFIPMKYKLELDHVIRVAVNKQVFGETNRPFPSSRLPPLQRESKCEVFVMVISSTLHMKAN